MAAGRDSKSPAMEPPLSPAAAMELEAQRAAAELFVLLDKKEQGQVTPHIILDHHRRQIHSPVIMAGGAWVVAVTSRW